MKQNLTILLSALLPFCGFTQGFVQVNSSANLVCANGVSIVLNDMNVFNNGTIGFSNSGNTCYLLGNKNVSFSGNGNTVLERMVLYKSNSELLVQQPVTIKSGLTFVTGMVNLGNYFIDLQSTGTLNGESETSRAYTNGTGYIQATGILTAPSNANPGNLGASISTAQDMGAVTIRRGHKVQSTTTENSILRYYDIIPANNSGLNATLRFSYFDAELNSLSEPTLSMWSSSDNINWTDIGTDSRDVAANNLIKTSIAHFSRFTLSGQSTALPLRFLSFEGACMNGRAHLAWKSAGEFNVQQFQIESSADGSQWTTAGSLPPDHSNSNEKTYSYTVQGSGNPAGFYRIKAVDIDGRITYSRLIRVNCSDAKDNLQVWPLPVQEEVNIAFTTEHTGVASIILYDSKGAQVQRKQQAYFSGTTILQLDMRMLASGMYYLKVDLGKEQRGVRVIKR